MSPERDAGRLEALRASREPRRGTRAHLDGTRARAGVEVSPVCRDSERRRDSEIFVSRLFSREFFEISKGSV